LLLVCANYFLQHLPGQHFALPRQQSATGDIAVAVPMNAAKLAIKRRYFIKSSFSVFIKELGHEFQSRRADRYENMPRGGGTSGRSARVVARWSLTTTVPSRCISEENVVTLVK
jgi:hypothetical protein